ncbi:hypothetical protein SALB1_2609 [Salinisphaera sp. LB1]|nr:hypothetical protein SALB1_2609 [Salinisphaera sp. LB1]
MDSGAVGLFGNISRLAGQPNRPHAAGMAGRPSGAAGSSIGAASRPPEAGMRRAT